jgi:hypothetical protein
VSTCRARPRRGAGVHFAWRRSNPLVIAVAFSAQVVADVANLFGAYQLAALHTNACVLLLPYSFVALGGGREAAIGLVIIVVVVFGESANSTAGVTQMGASDFSGE